MLGETLPWLDGLEHAKRPARLPTVVTVSEVRNLLAQLRGSNIAGRARAVVGDHLHASTHAERLATVALFLGVA